MGSGVDLQDLLQNIPVAARGAVITPEYHNSVRAAVEGLIDITSGQPVHAVFVPDFRPYPNGVGGNWERFPGYAKVPDNAQIVSGWMPLILPDGFAMLGVAVYGVVIGDLTDFAMKITLSRYTMLSDGWETKLLEIDQLGHNRDVSGRFEKQVVLEDIDVQPGEAPSRIIDNSRYTYALYISFLAPNRGMIVRLNGVRFTCQHP